MENITDENFDIEIAGQSLPVAVDFFATWCGPCKLLGPVLEKVAEEMKDKFVLLKADLDNIPKTAQKFGIDRVPTVVLFKGAKPVAGFVGLMQEEAIKQWLNESLNKQ